MLICTCRIVNVCAYVLGDLFKGWVKHQVEERNAEMCAKKEMMISMDPEMAAKFRASTHVSLSKGISANLLKDSSKRRRTLRQIKADKEAAEKKEQDAQNQQVQILQLQQELAQLRQDHATGQVAANLMSQFIENGLVQHDGDDKFVIHGSHGDREFSSKKKPHESM